MTGKHYQFHKRWTVDVPAASATHESGLVVRFRPLPQTESQMQAYDDADDGIGISKCWTPDECKWGVFADHELLQQVFDKLAKKHGKGNAHQMLARLGREAAKTWVWHKKKEHWHAKKIIPQSAKTDREIEPV